MTPCADRRSWPLVTLLLLSGVLAAAQIGKAIITLPIICAEMKIGVDTAGLLLAAFAILGAIFGIGGGAAVSWIGARRAILLGMAGIAIGNVMAVAAADPASLLFARAVEGCGFFGVVLAAPSLLTRTLQGRNRNVIMGVWSAYMPTGIMIMLLVGPALSATGWRPLWLGHAALALVFLVLLRLALPTGETSAARPKALRRDIAQVLNSRQCLLIACAFFAYSFHYFSLSFVLPLLFTAMRGYSLTNAGMIGAAAMGLSALGHLASAPLLRSRVPIWAVITAAFTAYAAAVVGIFSGGLSAMPTALLAAMALMIGGLAPGAFYSAAPDVTPTADTLPTTIGLFQQASNLGQFVGPIAIGMCIEHLGWIWQPLVAVPVALAGIGLALAIRRNSIKPAATPSRA
jgi:predicted MFS family arabinose efflux permease